MKSRTAVLTAITILLIVAFSGGYLLWTRISKGPRNDEKSSLSTEIGTLSKSLQTGKTSKVPGHMASAPPAPPGVDADLEAEIERALQRESAITSRMSAEELPIWRDMLRTQILQKRHGEIRHVTKRERFAVND